MDTKRWVLAGLLSFAAMPAAAMDIRSTDVSEGALMAKANICSPLGGGNTSPQLSWSGVPANAKSLALTMFDPDARGGDGFWHWVVLDIPPGTTGLAAGAGASQASLPAGAVAGSNGMGQLAYIGPCPPDAITHHYQITLWLLTEKPALTADSKPEDVGAYLAKHAIANARITPVYRK